MGILLPGDIKSSSRFLYGKNLVSLNYISKLLDIGLIIRGVATRGSHIWMILLGQRSVGILNLLWGRVRRDAQDSIVVFLNGLLRNRRSEKAMG